MIKLFYHYTFIDYFREIYFILKSSKHLLVIILCEEYIAYTKIAIEIIRSGTS
jgi:hypothetical protein